MESSLPGSASAHTATCSTFVLPAVLHTALGCQEGAGSSTAAHVGAAGSSLGRDESRRSPSPPCPCTGTGGDPAQQCTFPRPFPSRHRPAPPNCTENPGEQSCYVNTCKPFTSKGAHRHVFHCSWLRDRQVTGNCWENTAEFQNLPWTNCKIYILSLATFILK